MATHFRGFELSEGSDPEVGDVLFRSDWPDYRHFVWSAHGFIQRAIFRGSNRRRRGGLGRRMFAQSATNSVSP